MDSLIIPSRHISLLRNKVAELINYCECFSLYAFHHLKLIFSTGLQLRTFLGGWISNVLQFDVQMRDMCLCASSSDHKLKLMAKSAAMFTVISDVNKAASGKHE